MYYIQQNIRISQNDCLHTLWFAISSSTPPSSCAWTFIAFVTRSSNGSALSSKFLQHFIAFVNNSSQSSPFIAQSYKHITYTYSLAHFTIIIQCHYSLADR